MNSQQTSFNIYERNRVLRDYGQIHTGISTYLEICPQNIDEAQAALKYAHQKNASIRIRGAGHSMNGSSLPRKNELLINTQGMDHFCFSEPGTITVEAGTNLWDLDALLKRYGYELPVKNGGWSGPTVGGFIAAGGISPTKHKDDGFWNYVQEITCLSANAEQIVLTREDPLFAYLFGASGQLGFIVNAKLEITPLNANLVSYPIDVSGQVPQFYSRENPFKGSQFLTWFCCFGAVEQTQEMRSLQENFFTEHQSLFDKTELELYQFKDKGLHVPLVNESQGSFAGVEIRGMMSLTEALKPTLFKLLETYTKTIREAGFQNYSQAELAKMSSYSNGSLSKPVKDAFLELKKAVNPKDRLNILGT